MHWNGCIYAVEFDERERIEHGGAGAAHEKRALEWGIHPRGPEGVHSGAQRGRGGADTRSGWGDERNLVGRSRAPGGQAVWEERARSVVGQRSERGGQA